MAHISHIFDILAGPSPGKTGNNNYKIKPSYLYCIFPWCVLAGLDAILSIFFSPKVLSINTFVVMHVRGFYQLISHQLVTQRKHGGKVKTYH